jgi:RNA recognition motif-containing protein
VATRIYVGNLPYSATDQQLTELFGQYGDVTEASIIIDRTTGQSKGFGFVQMSDDDAARNAIAGLDGTNLDGRTVRVSEAQARPDSGGGRYGGGGRRDSSGYRDRDRRW